MVQSASSKRLQEMIEQAIEDHEITSLEMDKILMVATEDNYIDPTEQVLLTQLQDMIENGSVKVVP